MSAPTFRSALRSEMVATAIMLGAVLAVSAVAAGLGAIIEW
jgi:hypothetical protein